jgi:hypothetical protein
MLARAAQEFVQTMGLDSAHHDHIHVVFGSELNQHFDRMSVYEMSTIRGHTELSCQPKERLFQVPAQRFSQVSEGEAVHACQKSSRNIAGEQQMHLGIALHGKTAGLLDD